MSIVAGEKLTRQELGWLLAQEARGAAKSLREGVLREVAIGRTELTLDDAAADATAAPSTALVDVRISAPSGSFPPPPRDSGDRATNLMGTVETTLDELDTAIDMLTQLQSGPRGAARRGRIDLAALLVELAPHARVVLAPGAGTEVVGEESELRRMLNLLLGQSSTVGNASESRSEVRIVRDQDFVRVTVDLGPDTAASAQLERRWLSRMAVRLGGRLELEGGTQSILLPAEGATDQREVAELRKELAQAQKLGEAYARELAEIFAVGSPVPDSDAAPAVGQQMAFDVLVSLASALYRPLRGWVDGLRNDAVAASAAVGEASALCQGLLKRHAAASELLGELRRLAECPREESEADVELVELCTVVAEEAAGRASRHGIDVRLTLPERLVVRHRPQALRRLLRALVDHAIAATPRGSRVQLAVAPEGGRGTVRLLVDDGGPAVPNGERDAVLWHRSDPASLGRPAGLTLLAASLLAAHVGAPLELGEGALGACRAILTLRPA